MNTKPYVVMLQQRQQELLAMADSDEEAASAVELDQSRIGRLSRMDAMQQQAMSVEEQRRHKLELVRIDSALARIQSGDYGQCLVCEEPIPELRLQADPSATLCIVCAERAEKN